jgi:hypothetical protein
VQEFDDALLEPFPADGLTVPLVRLAVGEIPKALVSVGGVSYQYDRSYPVKGYAAVMPRYLLEQVEAGKKPLLIESPARFYVYFEA